MDNSGTSLLVISGTVIYQKDQNYRKDPEIPERTKKYVGYIFILFTIHVIIFKILLLLLMFILDSWAVDKIYSLPNHLSDMQPR